MDVSVLTLPKADLWRAWQIVSGGYSAFEVNVTTDAAVFDGGGGAKPRKGLHQRRCRSFDLRGQRVRDLEVLHRLQQGQRLLPGEHDGARARAPDGPRPRRQLVDRVLRRVLELQMGSHDGCTVCPRPAGARRPCFSGARASTAARATPRTTSRSSPGICRIGRTTFRTRRRWSSRTVAQVSSVDNRGQIARNTDSDTFRFTIGSSEAGDARDRSH